MKITTESNNKEGFEAKDRNRPDVARILKDSPLFPERTGALKRSIRGRQKITDGEFLLTLKMLDYAKDIEGPVSPELLFQDLSPKMLEKITPDIQKWIVSKFPDILTYKKGKG